MSSSLQGEFSLTGRAAGREQYITELHPVCYLSKYDGSIVEPTRYANHQT